MRISWREALLIESCWLPERAEAALELLRSWLREGAPFLLKQFASYFALYQREQLPLQVDDILWEHLSELILAASGAQWAEQCLHGRAVDIVLEHCAVLQPQLRREAFAQLLLRLGSVGTKSCVSCAVALARGEFTPQAQARWGHGFKQSRRRSKTLRYTRSVTVYDIYMIHAFINLIYIIVSIQTSEYVMMNWSFTSFPMRLEPFVAVAGHEALFLGLLGALSRGGLCGDGWPCASGLEVGCGGR